MFREIIQTLACLSVLNGSTLSLHLNNDRTATEHSSSSGIGIGGGPSMATSGSLQHHSNNPYRRMAAAAESERERMMFMSGGGGGGGGGQRIRPIITGRMHLTTGDLIDGGAIGVKNYPASSLTMLQDNEFPVRREPFFFAGDDDGDGDRGGGGGVFEEIQNPTQPDHYHRYDDGSFEVMDDIFNRGEGIYRKFPPIHHQSSSSGSLFKPQSPRGLQELFDHHESGTAADEVFTNHRVGSRDFRSQQKLQRKRTQQKKNQEKVPSSGSKPVAASSSSTSSVAGAIVVVAPAASTNSQEQQQQQEQRNTNQLQQQLLHSNSNNKRSGINSGIGSPPPVTHSIASQLMLRTARGQRQYDVPQIECPSAIDGMERFACPTPDLQGRYRCIDDHVLCDGFIDCPEGEDEDRRSCMFYKTTKAHLDVLADALLRWARGR